jgi:hypothetical protein
MRLTLLCALLTIVALSPARSAERRSTLPAPNSCRAKIPEPDLFVIHQIDFLTNSFTVQSGANFTRLTIRTDTQVTINGVGATFKDLRQGMKAKVTLAEPGVAVEIDATGPQATPNPFGNPAPGAPGNFGNPVSAPSADFAKSLVGTKWAWGSTGITFSQGKATYTGWTCDWKVTGPNELTLTIVTPKSRAGQFAIFDFAPDLKTVSITDFGGKPNHSHRLN